MFYFAEIRIKNVSMYICLIHICKKSYSDNRAQRILTHLNTELQDVQRIMVQNIDDVLQR
ncbi:UNVERIFIED_CONTAM: sec22bb [Trichonephila clavipes]